MESIDGGVDHLASGDGQGRTTGAAAFIRQDTNLAEPGKERLFTKAQRRRENEFGTLSRQLLQEQGRDPTVEEIANAMGLTPEKVREVIKISQEPISLETPIGEEEDSHLGDFIEDQEAVAPAEAASVMLLKEKMADVLKNLTERERKVLVLRFGLEDGHQRTLEEVGQEFGVTRERIRQIEAKALRKLRHPSRGKALKDYWTSE